MKRVWPIFVFIALIYFFFIRADHFYTSAGSIAYRKVLFMGATESAPILIALHGYGANMNDLIPAVKKLKRPLNGYFLQGPYSAGISGYSWVKTQEYLDSELIGLARGIKDIVSKVKKGPQKIYLLGFSLGAMLALMTVLHHPNLFDAVFIVAGKSMGVSSPKSIGDQASPVYIYHSSDDSIISIAEASPMENNLKKQGFKVEFIQYSGGHRISPKVHQHISQKMR